MLEKRGPRTLCERRWAAVSNEKRCWGLWIPNSDPGWWCLCAASNGEESDVRPKSHSSKEADDAEVHDVVGASAKNQSNEL